MVWNVFYYDINARKIKVDNVFNHGRYLEEVKKLLHDHKDIKTFSRKLESSTLYYFWSKSEWETVIHPWIGQDDAKIKIDVYWQLRNNWDRYVEYIWNFRP